MTDNLKSTVGILGAGTMGAGIAQVAAQAGWNVYLKDVSADVVRESIGGITKRFDRLVEKQRMTPIERDAVVSRLHIAESAAHLSDCELILEAVVENMDVKAAVLGEIVPVIHADAIIATNTSSLSVTELGERINQPHRTVGMHFFNPAPLMKLVEVIAGHQTAPAVVDRIMGIVESWGKKVARAADVPGFIVNHVARPYYLEAFRILEDGYATPDEIDCAMKAVGGFRMGPFELTDLIGHDINTETTRQVWRAVGEPALLHPSRLQEQLVSDGHLGRKTGRGVYDYATGDDQPAPAIEINHRAIVWSVELRNAVNEFVARAIDAPGSDLQNYIVSRILVAIVAQADAAHQRGVASKADIDTALRYGVNYPRGPFEWVDAIGPDRVNALLRALDSHVDDRRFAVELGA